MRIVAFIWSFLPVKYVCLQLPERLVCDFLNGSYAQNDFTIATSFLFDIFLGPSYNQMSPSVKYMTVNSPVQCKVNAANILYRRMAASIGSILICQFIATFVDYMQRLNAPFRYADGKVCLSLLGTWQGPGWIAGKSTLLQASHRYGVNCPFLNFRNPGLDIHSVDDSVRRTVSERTWLGG